MKIFDKLMKAVLPFWVVVSVSAQKPEAEPEELLLSEDVITVIGEYDELADQISAFKTGTPLIDVPESVTVVTDEQIKEQAITSIGEIVDYTPGVTTSQGEGHRDSVVFRGVRSTADFFVDGVRDDVQYYRALYNVEQVEILRGPSALYFGRGGAGGVLNRVLKKADPDLQIYDAISSIDTFGATYNAIDINQPLNDSIGFRLNSFYETLENHRDFYDGDRFGINPTVRFRLGETTTLDVSYEYNKHERFIDRGIPTGANGRPVEALASVTFGDPDQNFSSLESHVVRATINHEFNENWKGSLTASYGDYDKVYQNFYASGYSQSTDEATIDGYLDGTKRSNFVLSGDVVGEFEVFGIENKLILGGEYIRTSSDQDRYNTFWDTTEDDNEIFDASSFRLRGGRGVNSAGAIATNSFNRDLNDFTKVDIDVYSFYLQDEIALGDKLDLVLGARYDSFDINVNNVVTNEIRNRRDEQVSPRFGLVLKPVENLSLYGSYSETFLPRSGEQFANINGSNNALDPDTFSNVEAGIKWDIKDDLALTLAVFRIEESSLQVSDSDASTFDVIDTDTYGAEAQLKGYITDNWWISAGYSYLDGQQVDAGGDTGLRPRELPKHTFSIWNRYQVTERFGVGLGVIYQDESFVNNANTAVLPSYTRVDAAAYYKLNDTFSLQVNFENLFDSDYYPNSHSTHQVSVGRPFSAVFSVSATF